MPHPSCQESPPRPSLILALLCASIVAAYDRAWLARPVARLIPDGGPRPDRLSRLKARLLPVFEARLAEASRRGRPARTAESTEARRGPLLAALLTVATWLLKASRVPLRRRDVQDRLVCAYDRLRDEHGVSATQFCAALALSSRTFRSWRSRPPAPPPAPSPPPLSPPPRPDRATGRFDLDVTAPGVQIGGDTTDLRVLGVDLKVVAAQDLGAREQRLWEAFAVDERECADLVISVVKDALDGREGLQVITDQGSPYLAQAARDAYESLGAEHAPQREGAPTEKATVERAFGVVKDALAPLLDLTNRLAAALPSLRRADLARPLTTLLLAVFLRVFAAGRRHLAHPLAAHDPDTLRAIVDEQRDRARAEDRSVRLFLEAVHDEYAMPGSREAFVRTFRRYPLEDLRDAERRFRPYACRCVVRLCDRYFAACVRDAHERGQARRRALRALLLAAAEARHAQAAARQRTADLHAHPERRIAEALDVLADTWVEAESRFLCGGLLAQASLRCAVGLIFQREPIAAADVIESHLRAWIATRPSIPRQLCDAVRGALAHVIAHIRDRTPNTDSTAALVGAILQASVRSSPENPCPTPPPHLRI